jgi:hypothetical protein
MFKKQIPNDNVEQSATFGWSRPTIGATIVSQRLSDGAALLAQSTFWGLASDFCSADRNSLHLEQWSQLGTTSCQLL